MRPMRPIALFSLIALAACGPRTETEQQATARITTESAEAKRAIDSLNTEFDGHFNQGHGDLVAAQYTEDGELATVNAPVLKGRAAIAAFVTGTAQMKAAIKTTAVSVMANGPLAVERGDYTISMVLPGAASAVTETGAYLIHWHKVNGVWMRAADVATSAAPIPPPPASPSQPAR